MRCVELTAPHQRAIVLCDMRQGVVMLVRADALDRGPEIIARIPHPDHAEAVDLDRDGFVDLLVADLGTLFSSDETLGQIVWLRRDPASDRYIPVVLASGLGRVADVQAADMDGDGDLDLVAAEFGGIRVGSVLYLENRTRDWQRPDFWSTPIETRNGAIHVPIADLNGDHRPDVVGLVSQQHEAVVALLSQGRGAFRRETIFEAGDPSFGVTGIELADLDHDGDLDVLLSNGDSMQSLLVRPYHTIQWLENEGRFPFRRHELARMPGVHRARAGDLDGDGDLDIAAVSFLANTRYPERGPMRLDAVLWLENRGGQQFNCYALERITCDHAAMDLADVDNDGDLDLMVGNFSADGMHGPPTLPPMRSFLTVWQNQPLGGVHR